MFRLVELLSDQVVLKAPPIVAADAPFVKKMLKISKAMGKIEACKQSPAPEELLS